MKKILIKILMLTIFLALLSVVFIKDARPVEMFGPLIVDGYAESMIHGKYMAEGEMYSVKVSFYVQLINPTKKKYTLIFWCDALDSKGRLIRRLTVKKGTDDKQIKIPAMTVMSGGVNFFFTAEEHARAVRYERGIIVILPADSTI